jgi:hypothetical protein
MIKVHNSSPVPGDFQQLSTTAAMLLRREHPTVQAAAHAVVRQPRCSDQGCRWLLRPIAAPEMTSHRLLRDLAALTETLCCPPPSAEAGRRLAAVVDRVAEAAEDDKVVLGLNQAELLG